MPSSFSGGYQEIAHDGTLARCGLQRPDHRAENIPQTTARGSMDWDGGKEKGRKGAREPHVPASQLSRTESVAKEGWDWEGLLSPLAKHNKVPR